MEWGKHKIFIYGFLCVVSFIIWFSMVVSRDCNQHSQNYQIYKTQGVVKNYEYEVYIWGTIARILLELENGETVDFVSKIPPFSDSHIKVGLRQSFYFRIRESGNYPEVIQIITHTMTGPIVYKPQHGNCFTIDESRVIIKPLEEESYKRGPE